MLETENLLTLPREKVLLTVLLLKRRRKSETRGKVALAQPKTIPLHRDSSHYFYHLRLPSSRRLINETFISIFTARTVLTHSQWERGKSLLTKVAR
jgi:hypothetical protein